MKVKELKRLLENVSDEADVLMYLESRGGHAFEVYMGRHIVVEEGITDEELDEVNVPYDGNCLIKEAVSSPHGALILSDWKI